jgi:hypothetical protein
MADRQREPQRSAPLVVTYPDRVTPVRLGDHVEIRVWFRRRTGRVVYVPGISAFNPNMEYNGLQWVGVRIDNGFVSTVLDPKGGYLRKYTKLLRRDPSGFTPLGTTEDPHEGGITGVTP